MKFKVGDKVKKIPSAYEGVNNAQEKEFGIKSNDIYTIEKIINDDTVEIKEDIRKDGTGWPNSCFSLVSKRKSVSRFYKGF